MSSYECPICGEPAKCVTNWSDVWVDCPSCGKRYIDNEDDYPDFLSFDLSDDEVGDQ